MQLPLLYVLYRAAANLHRLGGPLDVRLRLSYAQKAAGVCPDKACPGDRWRPLLGLNAPPDRGKRMLADHPSHKRQGLLVASLLIICTFGMALRLYGLDDDGLWVDEIKTFATSRLQPGAIVQHQVDSAGHPPLLYLVTHFFFACCGQNDFIVRLPAALFGSLSILLVYKAGETLWTRDVGLVTAFLLAVNPYHVQYSQEARHYALMAFLALLSLIFLTNALRLGKKRLWIGFVLCTSLGLYNHYFALLLLPAEGVFAALVVRGNWLSSQRASAESPVTRGDRGSVNASQQALLLSLSLILVLVSYVPWVPVLQAQFPKNVQTEAITTDTASSFLLSLGFLSSVLTAYTGPDTATVVLYLALLLVGLSTLRREALCLALLWIGTPFAFLTVAVPMHLLHPRYVLFTLPMCLLVVANGLTAAGGLLQRALRSVGGDHWWSSLLVPASAAVVLGTLSAASLTDYYASEKTDWRDAAGYLAAEMGPSDIILADGEGLWGSDYYRVEDCLPLYFERYNVAPTPIIPVKAGLAQALAPHLGRPDSRLWAVVYHQEPLRTMTARKEIDVVEFANVSILRMREPPSDLLQNTESILEVLLALLPSPEARFDVHLALAETRLRSGRFERAQEHIEAAATAQPDMPRASRQLARTRAELDQVSDVTDQDIRHSMWRNLGLQIALRGHDHQPSPIAAGETLQLTLWWQALGDMRKDYTAFVHLVGPDGRIWSQQDVLLQAGEGPTSSWEVGDVVKQEYRLGLPSHTPPAAYSLVAGAYYWESGDRLPIWDEEVRRAVDDTIELGTVRVTAD
jgi:hypothetical protein